MKIDHLLLTLSIDHGTVTRDSGRMIMLQLPILPHTTYVYLKQKISFMALKKGEQKVNC
jgi:hypothetical protein